MSLAAHVIHAQSRRLRRGPGAFTSRVRRRSALAAPATLMRRRAPQTRVAGRPVDLSQRPQGHSLLTKGVRLDPPPRGESQAWA